MWCCENWKKKKFPRSNSDPLSIKKVVSLTQPCYVLKGFDQKLASPSFPVEYDRIRL